MKDQTLKKAYRRMCKEQKTQGYRYTVWGSVVALIGLVVVIAFLLLQACTTVLQDRLVWSLIMCGIGGLTAIVGGVIDLVGEAALHSGFEAYRRAHQETSAAEQNH